MHRLKRPITRLLNAAGLDVRWHVPRPPHALSTLLELYKVQTVFDVGANSGMSGEYLRNIGFRGEIVSFEPVRQLFEQLERRARADPHWHCENIGLGDSEGELVMRVSGEHGGASSFLRMTDHIPMHAPELRVVREEQVAVSTVDAVVERYYPRGDRLFLKLDVQGYEKQVLEGARRSIARIVGIRVEVSVVQSYHGEPLMCEMLQYVCSLGYRLTSIEPAWSNPATQEVYEFDATLFRPDKA
jgi:FkbM family methyltransferase